MHLEHEVSLHAETYYDYRGVLVGEDILFREALVKERAGNKEDRRLEGR